MAKQDDQGGKKKAQGFNTPFKSLKVEKTAPKPGRPAPAPPVRRPVRQDEEQEAFQDAMAGVVPFSERRHLEPAPSTAVPRVVSDDAESLAQLAELVSSHGEFDITDTAEYLEGASPGVNRQLLRSLRQGNYAVQDQVDLHGMTRPEAKVAVESFLTESRRAGKRCVLLIHGRGTHSENQLPVLKEQMRVWLASGRVGRIVLAFATARPQDGGAGAVYVLLRR